MTHSNLKFRKFKHRPFFYTSYVATIDGKIFVKKAGYWPIGSKADYETFTFLRAHADAIVQGKNSAKMFGQATIKTLHGEMFDKFRKKLNKKKMVDFIIPTLHPKELDHLSDNDFGYSPSFLQTHDVNKILSYLKEKKYSVVYIDGSALVRSFLEKNLLDEIFLTIAPKIFGGEKDEVVTIAEGQLFRPNEIKQLSLLSVKPIGDELYLRYKVNH